MSRSIFKELPQSLTNMGAKRDEVILHFLGHEIHHLDEVQRQAACKILDNQQSAAFTQAIRKDFGAAWVKALKEFSVRFPDVFSETAELRAAGQIANECAADLAGLHWMKLARPKRVKAFTERLIRWRQWNFENNGGYDVHDVIEEVVKGGLDDLPRMRLECLNRAADLAFASNQLPSDLSDLFTAARSPPLPAIQTNIGQRPIQP